MSIILKENYIDLFKLLFIFAHKSMNNDLYYNIGHKCFNEIYSIEHWYLSFIVHNKIADILCFNLQLFVEYIWNVV